MTKTDYQPSGSLALPKLPTKISKTVQKKIAEYFSGCEKFERDLDDLHDRHAALHENNELTLDAIAEIGAELRKDQITLFGRHVDLRWQRRDLLPMLIPDFERAAEAAHRDLQDVIESERQRFLALGIDAAAMRSGVGQAGEIQLLVRIKNELSVIAANRKSEDAKTALRQLKSSLLSVPGWRALILPWPAVSGRFATEISSIARLSESWPANPDTPGYSEISDELGINTYLPDRYQQPLNELVAMVGTFAGARRVDHALEINRRKTLGLLDKLPKTVQLEKLLFIDQSRDHTPTPPPGNEPRF